MAAVLAVSSWLAPSVAVAARQAICEHPEGSRCIAKKDTGRIVCKCLDGEQELLDPEITGANDDELMDACWDAWAATCGPSTPEWTACEEPTLGACEVTGDEGGQAECDCEVNGFVERQDVSALVGLDAEGIEDACHEQLEKLCEAPAPPPAIVPTPVPDAGEAASCSITPRAPAPWLLALMLGIGARARRRRGR